MAGLQDKMNVLKEYLFCRNQVIYNSVNGDFSMDKQHYVVVLLYVKFGIIRVVVVFLQNTINT